ncbi:MULTISPECIES: peptide deformylase [unclassified Rathayibacter]|uniref:peptide deformylase n=1 Tax=unclassified Rathayibacter TaxID=2609250 RepID=UPI000CE8E2A3|nr:MULTISPECIES: peptide deformylase [unclassified Rathayibacter]PPF27322.1 peptide deformylase [Rathayibacter sp. AY1F2]PPH46386.1 peptide deformylase [Rathayibacter sp. AY1F7]PPH80157.1 peptide deformylase [Rathayibacter sp. AY1D9]PPI03030.1 peptide deformylase [Rathayibacter sp. AY1D1]
MTERQIRIFGDPVLKTRSTTIETVDVGVRGLVEDLVDSVRPPGRAGVAAPQIGVNLRAFSYNVDGVIGYILNPEIIELSGDPRPVDEGCLSVPNLWYPAIRYPHAKVRGTDLDGNEIVLEGDGLMAQALQHECDHLDGRLYLDRLSQDDRRAAMKAVRESDWF